MSDESSNATSPYDAVLADLKAQRDEIDNLIKALEARALKSGIMVLGAPSGSGSAEIPHDFFHGMSIPDGAKKLLLFRKRDLGNKEIAAAFKTGGLVMNSNNPENTINSILSRRFSQQGDIVRVGRGVWGLKEWHPTIRAKNEKGDEPAEGG